MKACAAASQIPLKANTDAAVETAGGVDTIVMITRTGADVPMRSGRDVLHEEAVKDVSDECPPEEMSAEDPLFILYTSGSTGTPRACCIRPAAISSMRR